MHAKNFRKDRKDQQINMLPLWILHQRFAIFAVME